jgi:hypothetical protein
MQEKNVQTRKHVICRDSGKMILQAKISVQSNGKIERWHQSAKKERIRLLPDL